MKITICCSLSFANEAKRTKQDLESLGYNVEVPETILECEQQNISDIKAWIKQFVAKDPDGFDKLKRERMRIHLEKIVSSDAVLVLNYDKGLIKNYIGANTLIEMAIAFWYKKKIFLLNSIPELDYTEEIKGMDPIVLHNCFDLIK